MSDVFISYAREDRALAQALARDLEVRGYRVWWDAELVGSDDFQDVILAALAKARAVVVMWTKASVKSHFVRDEARYALHYKKLAAVKQPGLDVLEIPFGFQGQHTDNFENREQIVRAITKLGAVPAVAPAGPAGVEDTLDSVMSAMDVDAVLAWLERNPTHEQRSEAFRRVRHLMDAAPSKVAPERPERIAQMSNWRAFLSGLTFRVPSFQLSTQGTWTSIGLAIGLTLALVAGAWGAFEATNVIDNVLRQANWERNTRSLLLFPFFGLILLLLAWFAQSRTMRFIESRSFLAAYVLTPVFALLSGAVLLCIGATIAIAMGQEAQTSRALVLAASCIGVLLAITRVVLKVRAAR